MKMRNVFLCISAIIGLLLIFGIYMIKAQQVTTGHIYIDQDSLTIFLPGDARVSLVGFGFEVSINGSRTTRLLSEIAFQSFRFNEIPTPICLRLYRNGTQGAIPLSCPVGKIAIQALADSDVFWYDEIMGSRLVLLLSSGESFGFCQNTCSFDYIASTSTPTQTLPPTETIAPTYTATSTLTPTPEPLLGVLDPLLLTQTFEAISLANTEVHLAGMATLEAKATATTQAIIDQTATAQATLLVEVATPTPDFSLSKILYAVTGGRIRSCPSVDCQQIGSIKRDESIESLPVIEGGDAEGNNQWHPVLYKGLVGYVHSSVLAPSLPTPYETASPDGTMQPTQRPPLGAGCSGRFGGSASDLLGWSGHHHQTFTVQAGTTITVTLTVTNASDAWGVKALLIDAGGRELNSVEFWNTSNGKTTDSFVQNISAGTYKVQVNGDSQHRYNYSLSWDCG